mmetsp:Transcript_20052/g.64601  ORF Transcript_20052/g.64601 Transcript_20052/m.64601 type:complete len:80 (+) Transcript_20052:2636-2875(+)
MTHSSHPSSSERKKAKRAEKGESSPLKIMSYSVNKKEVAFFQVILTFLPTILKARRPWTIVSRAKVTLHFGHVVKRPPV